MQQDWILKTRHHLQKYEKKLSLKKLNKNRKLTSNEDLYFACLERFERATTNFFPLRYRFYDICESFISHFENLHYLLHLNESEDDVSEEKDLKNDSSVEIRGVNKVL